MIEPVGTAYFPSSTKPAKSEETEKAADPVLPLQPIPHQAEPVNYSRKRNRQWVLAISVLIGCLVTDQALFAQQGSGFRANFSDFDLSQDRQEQESPDAERPDPPDDGPDAVPPSDQVGEGLIEQPSSFAAAPPAPISSLLSQLETISAERAAELGGGTGINIVSGAQGTVLGSTDTGDLLANSIFNTGVYSRQISPVITNTRVRGYRYAEIRTTLNGASWFSVRPDADTPLSRFDSSVVQDVAIIRGPYNVRLGPGFAFIDVSLRTTPRHTDGYQWGAETKFSWDTNGDQWFGRQAIHGGSADRGWRIGYGHRGGIDYEAGDGLPIGASYNARDWDFSYGLDLTDCSSLEFNYIRTAMTDVDTPGQVNDFSSLIADGFAIRLDVEDNIHFDKLSVNGWYNLSRFQGTVANKVVDPADPNFFFSPPDPVYNFRFARVTSAGATASAGARVKVSWGDLDSAMLTLGTDFILQRQTYLETRVNTTIAEFGVPKARQYDNGIFLDVQTRPGSSDRLTVKAGGRIDLVKSDNTATPETDGRSLALDPGVPFEQFYTLGAGYLSADYEINEEVALNAGVGYAQRAPSLTDLYGDLPHLSIMQEGAFFLPHGELLLKTEKALQADVGLTMRGDIIRGGVSAFYAQVDDFITYDAPHLLFGPHLQHAIGVNHDTRMAGGEFFGELDLNASLTAFAALSYVQAKDLELDEPLWGIAPLDTRLGLRLTDPCCQKWGVEYTMRLVDDQDRISSVGFTGEVATPGFNTHSIRGYYRATDTIVLIAGVDNLGDALYREHLDTRFNLTAGVDPARGILRRGVSYYFAMQAEY